MAARPDTPSEAIGPAHAQPGAEAHRAFVGMVQRNWDRQVDASAEARREITDIELSHFLSLRAAVAGLRPSGLGGLLRRVGDWLARQRDRDPFQPRLLPNGTLLYPPGVKLIPLHEPPTSEAGETEAEGPELGADGAAQNRRRSAHAGFIEGVQRVINSMPGRRLADFPLPPPSEPSSPEGSGS